MKEIEKTRKLWIFVSCVLAFCCALLLLPCVQQLFFQMIGVLFHGESRETRLEKIFFQLYVIGFGGVIACLAFAFILFVRFDEKLCAFLSAPSQLNLKTNVGITGIGIIALYSVFTLFLCFVKGKSIWFDESFTVSLCSHSFPEMISLTAQDVHPPLYYLILKSLSFILGGSLISMRIVSALPIILFMVVGFSFLSKEVSLKAAILFSLFVFSSGHFMYYNIELRMYSWAAFFCGLMGIFSYYVLKRENILSWLFLVLSAVCAAYTQYFAAVLALCIFIPLCIYKFSVSKSSRKFVVLSCLLGALLYSPWIPIVIRQFSEVSQGYWIPPLTPYTILNYLYYLCPGVSFFSKFGLIFMSALLLFFLFGMKKTFWCTLCTFSPLVLILIGVIISLLVQPVFTARYVIPGFFLIAFASAVILDSIKDTKILTVSIFILLMFSLSSAAFTFRTEAISLGKYRTFIETVEPKIESNTKFVFIENEKNNFCGHQKGIWATYFPGHEIYSSSPSSWGYLFNSDFLPLEDLSFDSPLCVVAFDGTLDSKQEAFIASLVRDSNWTLKHYELVSPIGNYLDYKVFFFFPDKI